MRCLHLLAGVLLASAGCGDNLARPPAAGDFDGLWLITARTRPAEGGALVTETRDGAPRAIRGDALFTSRGDAAGTWHIRLLVLDDGVLAPSDAALVSAPAPIAYAITVEPDRWVMADPAGEIAVYATELDGDRLTLTWDVRDPRGTATAPPTSWIFDRAPPWSPALIGTWNAVSLEYPDRTLLTDTCIDQFKMTMGWTFDPRLVIDATRALLYYWDDVWPIPVPPCTVLVDELRGGLHGLAEQDGRELRLWTFPGEWDRNTGAQRGANALVFDVQREGDLATLTLTGCLPLPHCNAGQGSWFDPTLIRLVLRRAGAP